MKTKNYPLINDAELIFWAKEVATKAYCPYSNFRVGAAIFCDDGTIVTGCNVENASYGLTICAERNALFSMVAQGKTALAIAVTCPSAKDAPNQYKMPCGACRQVMAEHFGPDVRIIVDEVATYTIDDLLPEAFKL